MSQDESDSSLSDAESSRMTSVLLGYASKQATEDTVSQLGGLPSWLDPSQPPNGGLAQCKNCNSFMTLLLQLNGELPDRFPGHERRLYIWACRRKACRRKDGSIRAFRAVRALRPREAQSRVKAPTNLQDVRKHEVESKEDIGNALFGVTHTLTARSNPFSSITGTAPSSKPGVEVANPFATTPSLAAKPPQRPISEDETVQNSLSLPDTFARKAQISSPVGLQKQTSINLLVPWPELSKIPKPFPAFYLDAELEYLSTQESSDPTNNEHMSANRAVFMDIDESGGSSAFSKDDKTNYEDTHDKTFQHFADVLAQNPEQVLRYEFDGSPLLYSRTDAVGKQIGGPSKAEKGSKISTVASTSLNSHFPRCPVCGSSRTFEVQLTPHAISELEELEDSATLLEEGMEWGTIIVGVCSKDCLGEAEIARQEGEQVVYLEEQASVQWEEIVSRAAKK